MAARAFSPAGRLQLRSIRRKCRALGPVVARVRIRRDIEADRARAGQELKDSAIAIKNALGLNS